MRARYALVPGFRLHAAPSALHHARLRTRLHLAHLPCAPDSRASDALHVRATRPSALLLVRPFAPCRRLLRPLLTSRSGSSPSPFQAQGEISPGKSALLHRTVAACTSPGPWPRELRGPLPARPARQRLISDSCPSARSLRSTLPPHARSPSRSCASLRSL